MYSWINRLEEELHWKLTEISEILKLQQTQKTHSLDSLFVMSVHISSFPSLQLCCAWSSMPRAYRRNSWPWILKRSEFALLFFKKKCSVVWVESYSREAHLQKTSVTGRISPSQFHTDTAGGLPQHRPHRKESGVFCLSVTSLPELFSVRCIWDPLLLALST